MEISVILLEQERLKHDGPRIAILNAQPGIKQVNFGSKNVFELPLNSKFLHQGVHGTGFVKISNLIITLFDYLAS